MGATVFGGVDEALCLLADQAAASQKISMSLNFDWNVLVERLLNDFTRNVADDLLLHLAIFEDQQRRNAANAITLWSDRTAVYIHFADFHFTVVSGGYFVHNRRQRFAGAAPC